MKNSIKIQNSKKYQWNPEWGNKITKVDIKKVIKELKIIEAAKGEITPESVVEFSRNKSSILYNYFEWDNDKAADSWRRQQASSLLRHVEVKVISAGETREYRAYEVIKMDNFNNGSQYRTIDLTTNDNIEFIKNSAVADLIRVRNRLETYSLLGAIKYVDKAIKELQREEIAEVS